MDWISYVVYDQNFSFYKYINSFYFFSKIIFLFFISTALSASFTSFLVYMKIIKWNFLIFFKKIFILKSIFIKFLIISGFVSSSFFITICFNFCKGPNSVNLGLYFLHYKKLLIKKKASQFVNIDDDYMNAYFDMLTNNLPNLNNNNDSNFSIRIKNLSKLKEKIFDLVDKNDLSIDEVIGLVAYENYIKLENAAMLHNFLLTSSVVLSLIPLLAFFNINVIDLE